MPYAPQSFSHLEILRTPKLNQMAQNIKLIRTLSKGNDPPEQTIDGLLWLNTEVASSGIIQISSGSGFMELETLINFTPGVNLLTNGDFSLWRKVGTSIHSTGLYNGLWRYFADGWVFKSIEDDFITLQRNSFALGQTEIPDEPQYYVSIQRADWAQNQEDTESYHIQARVRDVRKIAGGYATFSCRLRSSLPVNLSCKAVSYYGNTLTGATFEDEVDGPEIVVSSNWQWHKRTFLMPSLETAVVDDTSYFAIDLAPVDIELHTLFIANAKLENFPTATAYVNEQPVNNLRRAETRFYKSFDLTSTPRGNDGSANAIRTVAQANGNFSFMIPLNPNLSLYRTNSLYAFTYNPAQAIVEQQAYDVTNAVSVPVSATVISPYCVVIEPTSLDATHANATIAIQIAIDADVFDPFF